jgi:hemoglobin-like flavoprotein
MHPEATNIFGLDNEEEQCVTSGSYVKNAKKFVSYCDSFMDMLGPDSDMLTDILAEEGRKHANIGVKLEHYPSMGVALIEGVRTLDRKFNDDTELCWKKVYSGISHDMGKAGIYHRAGRRHTM